MAEAGSNFVVDELYCNRSWLLAPEGSKVSMIALVLSMFCFMSGRASLIRSLPLSTLVVPAFVPLGQVGIIFSL